MLRSFLLKTPLKCSRKTPAFAALSSRTGSATAQAIALQTNVYAIWNSATAAALASLARLRRLVASRSASAARRYPERVAATAHQQDQDGRGGHTGVAADRIDCRSIDR